MAFNVYLYTFQKRINSTKTVSNAADLTLSCVLKDNTDIINPTLIIKNRDGFNPWNYNYCWVTKFNRYYFINTWRYVVGQWECECAVDVLATFRPVLENKSKYVLRSSYKYNRSIIDDFYPALAFQPNYYIDTADFQFYRQISQGNFIIGVVNRDSSGFGAVSFYELSSSSIKQLIRTMLPQASEAWTSGFSGLTDTLYRSIYGPFDYIKSCKWFPIAITTGTDPTAISFGNYTSTIYGNPIPNNIDNWFSNYRDVELPPGWLSLDAKERCLPYAHIYLVINPWGVIELNPTDFTDTRTIRCRIYADLVSGDGILKVYKVVGTTEYFILQKNARLSYDVDLTQTSIDATGAIIGGLTAVGGLITGGTATTATGLVSGIIMGESGIMNAVQSATPSISGSIGQSFNSVIGIDGKVTLIYQNTYFAQEDNAEYGKPLCENTLISTIPGFIKCADGDIDIAGAMKQELEMISDFLVNGFFYE